jgi:hypothetical protein
MIAPKDMELNAKVRRQLLWDGAHVDGAAKDIWERCSEDPLFYVNMFCWTYNPRLVKDGLPSDIPFVAYNFQDDAILSIMDAVRNGYDVGVKKSRDMGASWVNLIALEWFWHFRDGMNFLLISRNESYVDEPGNPKSLFWKIDFIHRHQPKWLLPRDYSVNARDCRRALFMKNPETGSVFSGESTTGDVARGDRRTAILMDEFAAFDVKSGYEALKATRDATDCRIFNSTPKGASNAFHDVIFKSSARIITMHWSMHPVKGRGLYSSVKDEATGNMTLVLKDDWKGIVRLGERGSKEVKDVAFPEDYPFILDGRDRSPWYDFQCTRAVSSVEIAQELDIDFAGGDYIFFEPIAVERYKEKWCKEPVRKCAISIGLYDTLSVVETPKGNAWFFENPEPETERYDPQRRFVIGADVAAGTGASNSTLCAYDCQSKEKVFEFADPNILPDDFARLAIGVGRLFNDALIVPDRSGPTGEVFVRRLMAEHYGNIWLQRDKKELGGKVTDKPGVWLNPAEKTAIMQNYRDAIGRVAIVNRSGRAMDECLCFIMLENGYIEHQAAESTNDPSGARSNHGDLVIADALATIALEDGAAMAEEKQVEKREVSPGTLAWRMEVARRTERVPVRGEFNSTWNNDTFGKGWR